MNLLHKYIHKYINNEKHSQPLQLSVDGLDFAPH